MSSFPCIAEVLHVGAQSDGSDFWWTVTSDSNDNMIVGDVPSALGSKEVAEYVARCCNIVYRYGVSEALEELKGVLDPALLASIKDKLLKG
jgi:hypothetical protein